MTEPVTPPRPLEMDTTMNDRIPTSNPSLRTVLIVLGCAALGVLVLAYRSSLGF
jgi:hypothetical protein